jgi:curli production assembly/transport component CsgG
MKRTLISLSLVAVLSGCAVIQTTGLTEVDPTLTTQRAGVKKEFDTIPAPAAGRPVSVAVYSFADKTGQRRPQMNVASLSSAVTQGAETFLIQALQSVGQGQWFEVVERVGIDNLTKERLIIRQMREAYEGNNAKPLMPMQFAGMIIEGGIVGYDTSTTSGGAGMRIFGIGKQTQWSQDTVTVSIRAVSVNTGKVLAVVTVQKTILSTADSATALKFFDAGTQAFEAEAGLTINEPGTYAVKSAIEMAVVELIKEGQRKSIWDFKSNIPVVVAPPVEKPVAPVEKPVISSEIRKTEEKKDVVVQPQAVPETLPSAAPEVKKEEVKKQEEVKKEAPKALFGQRTLNENSFLYAEQTEASTRKWWIAKGTIVNVQQPGIEGWWKVTMADGTNRGGWIQSSKLGN